MLELLGLYQALPKDCSLETIKFILYLEGLEGIRPQNFMRPNLNMHGCTGLQLPIDIATTKGLEETVKLLINNGIEERTFNLLFPLVNLNFFACIDPLDLNKFIQYINNLFGGRTRSFITDLEERCRIAELFIKHANHTFPTEDEKAVDSKKISYTLLPFFIWLAKNNRADLLENNTLRHFFTIATLLPLNTYVYAFITTA
ncbi:MAG: hypothetical protein H0W64_09310 [Gammaproteobacteria bacterium]|nr:hypothetical protein [Gammaproteobacteria bacterium]